MRQRLGAGSMLCTAAAYGGTARPAVKGGARRGGSIIFKTLYPARWKCCWRTRTTIWRSAASGWELGRLPITSGRRRPIEVPGSEFDVDVDCVIMALGTSAQPPDPSTHRGLEEINKKGGIVVNEDSPHLRENVYAGGDAHHQCCRHPGYRRHGSRG